MQNLFFGLIWFLLSITIVHHVLSFIRGWPKPLDKPEPLTLDSPEVKKSFDQSWIDAGKNFEDAGKHFESVLRSYPPKNR